MLASFAMSLLVLSNVPCAGPAEELDLKKIFQQGVPVSPFAKAFYGYADAVLERGREVTDLAMDENLLRLLFFLQGLSSQERYPLAAEEILRRSLENAPESIAQIGATGRAPSRAWLLWGTCFDLAPEASKRAALSLVKRYEALGKDGAAPSPRVAGLCIRAWAEAYARTQDGAFLSAIDAAIRRSEETKAAPAASRLSFAIDCDGAARKVPEPLRTRLAVIAAREDAAFCSLPGFPPTPLWLADGDGNTMAKVGVMCVSRYENAGDARYRRLIVAAADAYLDSTPGEGSDVWPMTVGLAISLELAAFRATAKERYFKSAFRLGEFAVQRFFDKGPLPRASLRSEHYENTTGADTLALALVDLHLTLLTITAVRAPANTVDR